MRSALLAVAASGCATLVRGSTDTVTVDADRDSTFVFVDGVAAGVTPAVLEVKRSRSHLVEVVRPGYRIAQADMERSFNVVAAAGSFLGGSFGGLAVDATSGALYDLDPSDVRVALIPDSAGVEAARVSVLVRDATAAARDGFPLADPNRRRSAPWVTVQLASGAYVGGGGGDQATTGGLGGTLLVGVRGRRYSARLSGTAATGFLFDNSERWEIAALAGAVGEADGGRFRFGLSAGPGITGGRENGISCFLLCDGSGRRGDALPTRVGLSVLGEAYLFVTPRIGFGVQAPLNVGFGATLGGVMIGWKYEGL